MVPPPAMTTSAQIAIGRCVSTLAHRRRSARAVRARRDEGEHNQIGDRQGRDEQERQPDAADFVEPAAEHRTDDDAEAAARHCEPHRAAALLRTVQIGDEREADDPRHAVGRALQQPRDEQHRQRLCVGEGERRGRQQREPEDHRAFAPEAIRKRAHRNRQHEQREAERREQQTDHGRAGVESRRVIRQDRNRDGVRDEIGERRSRDTGEDDGPGDRGEGESRGQISRCFCPCPLPSALHGSFQDQTCQRRQDERQPVRAPVGWIRLRLNDAGVAEIAAAVHLGVAVQQLDICGRARARR